MNETEPKYFTEFRQHIDKKFEETNKNIDDTIEDLATSVQRQFIETEKSLKDYMEENFASKTDLSNFASKLDLYDTETRLGNRLDKIDEKLEKIEGHIGRYEIRAQNVEQIVLADHKTRIQKLELALGV